MPVEIKEIVIQSIIEESAAQTDNISTEDMELIVLSCVKQMRQILAQDEER